MRFFVTGLLVLSLIFFPCDAADSFDVPGKMTAGELDPAKLLDAVRNAIKSYSESGDGDTLKKKLQMLERSYGKEYREIINNGKDAEGCDITDLLKAAINFNHRDIIELLISQGMGVNVRDREGNTPLHIATLYHHEELAAFLLENGADINGKDKLGRTPLHIAVKDNNRELILLLLSKGADRYELDNKGNPPRPGPAVKSSQDIRISEGSALPVSSISFSPGGRFLVSGSKDGSLRMWSPASGKLIAQLSRHRKSITSVSFSPGGFSIASGSEDGTVILWEWSNENIPAKRLPHSSPVRSLCFSRDGKYLISGCADGSVQIWNVISGNLHKSALLHAEPVNSMCVSPDNKYLATGSDDGTLKVLDFPGLLNPSVLSERTSPILTTCFSQMGRQIASGDESGEIVIRSFPSGNIVKRFQGHEGSAVSITFSPGGRYLLSGGSDGKIRLWDAITWNEAAEPYSGTTGIRCARFSPGGKYIFAGCEDGTIRILSSQSRTLLATLVGFINGEWISLTPGLYFDCSLEGAKYILLPDKGDFVTLDQYRTPRRNAKLLKECIGEKVPPERRDLLPDPPEIRIISPSDGSKPESEIIPLRVEVRGECKIRDLLVLINGRPATGQTAALIQGNESGGVSLAWDNPESQGTKEIKVDVRLQPGLNRIVVFAISADGIKSLPRTIAVQYLYPHSVPSERLFLLSVGVNDYEDRELNLDYAAPDAKAIESFFAGMKGLLFKEVRTCTLIDADASDRNIIKSLKEIKDDSTERDLIIVFLAGHGVRNEKDEFFFLCRRGKPDDLSENALSWRDFQDTLMSLRAKNILLIIDACHSGSILKAEGAFTTNENLAEGMIGVIVFAACRGNERSRELPGLGGVFTQTLISALLGKAGRRDNRSRRITLLETEQYVSDLVPRITQNGQHPVLLEREGVVDIPLSVVR